MSAEVDRAARVMPGGEPISPVKTGAGALGVGAAACLACCAGPILGALSAIGIASAAGYLIAGSVAVLVGIVAAVLVVLRRRRRHDACATQAGTVALVATPRLETRTGRGPTDHAGATGTPP
ncbi:MAG TPA: hypothetical protein VK306_14850 [Acidimicrobiales bacterium]|nr:hypothetical protein [Acidimicrobiales bacterium]